MSTPDTATGRERRDPVPERAIREATDGPWWVGFQAGITEVRGRLAAARQASAPTAPAPDVGAAASAHLSSAVHAIVQADPPLPRAPETHEERRAESVRSDLRTTIGHAVVLADGDARAAVATADAVPPRVPYIGEDEGSRLDVDYSNPHFGAYDAARQTVAQGAETQLAAFQDRVETVSTAVTALAERAASGLTPADRLRAHAQLGIIQAHTQALAAHYRNEVLSRGPAQAKTAEKSPG
ncbi:hypothetical protein LO772_35590 [Yinghuangia sp. ASG 101]|uniref:hypothetical protein n=1 Tax=Yinghuangia sp. ASG 101 TaxID=2896848 RepID=UPI001E5FCFCB|nr:hypothetical protein [Yinghuangia sp. ASG 101]UGQ12017.1 hypothetical protein LO772_35590 [Yinghuangia sp. ASG 101]